MNAFKSLQSLGIATIACLAFGGQNLLAAKKQDKKGGSSHGGHAAAPAHAHARSSPHGGGGKPHMASAPSHRSSSHANRLARSSGGPSPHQRMARASHHQALNNVAVNRSHSNRNDVS